MSKFWVCKECLPEEVEELAIGSLLKTSCVICGEAKEPDEMKCVRFLPERLEKKLGLRRNPESVEKMNAARAELKPEVDTDGRTVWVNAPNCIGRFCPVSGEVMKADGHVLGTPPDWREWRALMTREHGCIIDEKYQPEWSKGHGPQAKQEG